MTASVLSAAGLDTAVCHCSWISDEWADSGLCPLLAFYESLLLSPDWYDGAEDG